MNTVMLVPPTLPLPALTAPPAAFPLPFSVPSVPLWLIPPPFLCSNLVGPAGPCHGDGMKRTPLYDWHVGLGARMVPFAGWEMPVQYSSILDEHRAVRRAVGLFDVSHMGEAEVRGPEAEALLDYVATNKIAGLPVGKAIYTVLCHPDGGVVDDVIISRWGPERFQVCLNASNVEKDLAWLQQHAAGRDVVVEDQSAAWGQLALQGPKALAVLAQVTGGAEPPPRFQVAEQTVAGVAGCWVSRTGYTGEDGVEIYIPAADVVTVAEALRVAGNDDGLQPCGLGARDSLRLEAGYPLYGHEIDDTISPLEAGLGWVVKWNKGDFVGRAALEAQKQAGPPRRLVHFRLGDRRIARAGTPVWAGDREVGQVVSGSWSPILEDAIGSALVESGSGAAGWVVDLRGTKLPLQIVRK